MYVCSKDSAAPAAAVYIEMDPSRMDGLHSLRLRAYLHGGDEL